MDRSINLKLEEHEMNLAELGDKYSEEERREIYSMRERYEYKIARPQKKKIDLLRYLAYEMNLNYQFKYKIISIDRNIHRLFKISLKYYRKDVLLWKEYIKYVLLTNNHKNLDSIFIKSINNNSNNIDLRILYSNWLFIYNNDFEKSRIILTRSIRTIKNNTRLLIELFRLECNIAMMVNKRLDLIGTYKNIDYSIALIVMDKCLEESNNSCSIINELRNVIIEMPGCNILNQYLKDKMGG
eukprot:GHVP01014970.1.p2 GENE.GHVP01014970.1~~GHVP01014970.1.p2  ORF type:complete len:241 (+),score=24.66 GHVP01014970.1:1152-1874(+)